MLTRMKWGDIVNSPLMQVLMYDNKRYMARNLSGGHLPKGLFCQPEYTTVKAKRIEIGGVTFIDDYNAQVYEPGDYRLWDGNTPDDQLHIHRSWTAKKMSFEATYTVLRERAEFVVAHKTGYLQAALIPVPFFVWTLDNKNKPFYYPAGSIMVRQVTPDGQVLSDEYAMPAHRFSRYQPVKAARVA